MEVEKNRNNFIFGLTLTELAFILFFILVFISLAVIDEKETKIVAYKKVFETIPEFKNKSVPEQTKWLKELVEKSSLNIKKQELIKENKALKDFYEKIVETFPGLKDKTESERKKWLKKLVVKSGLMTEKDELIKKNESLREKLADKNNDLIKMKKKVKPLGGFDHPPCWKNPKTKKAEYIYDIILKDSGITTHPGYKKYLETEFKKIPGHNNIIGTKNISIREFRKRTTDVFNYSKASKPECRYYVRIFDETTTKEPYKIINDIQDHFRHYEYETTYSKYKKGLTTPTNSMIKNRRNKTGSIFNKKFLREFTIKDCSGENRKYMDRYKLWRDLCSHYDREEALKNKSKSSPDDSSKGNGTSSSLIKQLDKIRQMGKILQTP